MNTLLCVCEEDAAILDFAEKRHAGVRFRFRAADGGIELNAVLFKYPRALMCTPRFERGNIDTYVRT